MESARYFFSRLWMAATKVQPTIEQIDDILIENEIDILLDYYRLVDNKDIFLDLQEYYTQLLVEKINEFRQTHFSFTLESHEAMTFFEYLMLTHQIELGVGLLSGTVTGLAILSGHSGWGSMTALPGLGVLGWMAYTYYQWQIQQQTSLTLPKKYLANPHRQYKIWLSQDIDEELSLAFKNQLKDLRFKEGALLSLVYDSQKISFSVHQRLLDFCNMHQVTAIDIREDVFPRCQSQQEQELIKIYQLEMDHISRGGSLFIANQVLRWLKPVYELGMYADFNVNLGLRKLNSPYAFKHPMIFDIKKTWAEDESQIQIHPNISMITHTQDAKSFIEKIQKNIIQSYALQNEELYYYAYEVIKSFKRFQDEVDYQDQLEIKIINQLKEKTNHLEIRQAIRSFYEQFLAEQEAHKSEDDFEETIQISENMDRVIDNCCGGDQLLKTLQAHLQEEIMMKKNVGTIMEYGFEYHHLVPRTIEILKDNPKEPKDEECSSKIDLQRKNSDEDVIERSAIIIQSFFKDRVKKQNNITESASMETGWEFMGQNQHK